MANTTYSYADLDAINEHIRRGMRGVIDAGDDLIYRANDLVAETWGGEASSSYTTAATSIKTDLDTAAAGLDALATSVVNGAGDMQNADRRGGSTLNV